MIDYLLGSISKSTFFDIYYEKKFLYIKRNDKNYYKNILTLQDIDQAIYSVAMYHPDKRVVNNQVEKFPDYKDYTFRDSRKIDPIKFVKKYAEGNTLALAQLQDNIASLQRLVNEMQQFFKHRFQTNIYLTPQHAQGFAPHYDTHDVFVLQFEGEKVWRIYDTFLPLADKTQPFEKGEYDTGKIAHEFTLKQGDLLYIPRGLAHDAFCQGSASGHITLGLVGQTWAEQLAELLINESQSHLALRKYPKFHDQQVHKPEAEEVAKIVQSLIRSLTTHQEVLDEQNAKQRTVSPGGLLSASKLHQISPDSQIMLADKALVSLQTQEEILLLRFVDTKITLPLVCLDFITVLLEANAPVRISEVYAELDDESRVALAQKLIENGILILC